MHKNKNINLAQKLIIFALNITLLFLVTIFNTTIINAQADYMGPGVPYSSKCYNKTANNPLSLKYKLELNKQQMYVNNPSSGNLILISNKQFSPQKIQLTLTYNSNLINITKITIPSCTQTPEGTQIDNTNGILTLILDKNSCPGLSFKQGQNLIAKIEFIPIQEGSAILKLHEMSDNPQSYTLMENTSINIKPVQDSYEIQILTTNTTPNPTNPYQNPTPNPTIVPPNGIFDETNIILATILIGIATIIYSTISNKTKKIKSKYIDYEED